MGKTYECLNDRLIDFIGRQKMFFVGTAPLSGDGSVNLSPKGYDSIRILDDKTLLWLDLGGSGIETFAHLQENGRITMMFCAFEGPANIVRIYGRGQAFDFDHPEFPELMKHFPDWDRARAVVRINIERVSDSCGWGVPFYEFKGERDQLQRWVGNKPYEEWKEYRYEKNKTSVDGLPGLTQQKSGDRGDA